MTLALANAAFAIEIGQMERAVRATLNLEAVGPKIPASPGKPDPFAKLRGHRLEYLQKRGIRSDRELEQLLSRGTELANQALARNDLIDDQKEALLVGRSRLFALQSRTAEAEADARRAVQEFPRSVPARLALSDALADQERYDAAIGSLRNAAVLVDDWSRGPTQWTSMLYGRPAGQRARQRQRREVAAAFHRQITTEISLLQSLDRLARR